MQLRNKRNYIILAIIIFSILGLVLTPKIKDYQLSKYNLMGKNYLMVNDFNNAEKVFKKALFIDPTCYFAQYGLGKIAFARGNFDEAEEYFLKSLNSDPRPSLEPRIHASLANVYLFKGDYQKAVDYADEVFNYDLEPTLEPDRIEADTYLIRGNAFLLLGETEKAKENFEKCSEMEIQDAMYGPLTKQTLNNGFGILYTLTGECDKAIKYYNANLKPEIDALTRSTSYFGIGKCNFYLKDYEKAIENLEQGLQLFETITVLVPNQNFMRFQFFQVLGQSNLRLGNLERAKEYFEKIVEVQDKIEYNIEFEIPFAETSVNMGLGEYFLAKGENSEALTYFNTGLKTISSLNPVFFNEKINIHFFSLFLHYNAARTYYLQGNITDAKKELQEAEKIISSISTEEKPFIENLQWFENGKSIFQNINSLQNELGK